MSATCRWRPDRPEHVDGAAVGLALGASAPSRVLDGRSDARRRRTAPGPRTRRASSTRSGLREHRRHAGDRPSATRASTRATRQLQGGRANGSRRPPSREQGRERDRDPDLVGAQEHVRSRPIRTEPTSLRSFRGRAESDGDRLGLHAGPSHRLMRRATLGPRRSSTDCCSPKHQPAGDQREAAATAQRRQRSRDTGRHEPGSRRGRLGGRGQRRRYDVETRRAAMCSSTLALGPVQPKLGEAASTSSADTTSLGILRFMIGSEHSAQPFTTRLLRTYAAFIVTPSTSATWSGRPHQVQLGEQAILRTSWANAWVRRWPPPLCIAASGSERRSGDREAPASAAYRRREPHLPPDAGGRW